MSRRLFVAIPLPDTARSELERVQRLLRAAVAVEIGTGPGFMARDSPLVRWTVRDQLHLTLAFLGNVASGSLDGLCRSLDAACRPVDPLGLRLGRIGVFPYSGTPRILWVKIENCGGRLFVLQRAVESCARPFVKHLDERLFSAHVTIARVNRADRASARTLVSAAAGIQPTGEWTAGQVDLLESLLSPAGATHRHLASFPLGAGA